MNGFNRTRSLRIGLGLLGAALVASSAASGSVGAAASENWAAGAAIVGATGQSLGTVKFTPRDGGSKTAVRARVEGLSPGFHGFHVHSAGTCDPDAVDAAGNRSPFFTAGGHFNPDGTTHGSHAGDLPPLYVAQDGTGYLEFVTDRFQASDLLDADGASVIIHAGPDNLAHIPPRTATGADRYHSHVDNVFGPDTATRATGDAGARSACGVIAQD